MHTIPLKGPGADDGLPASVAAALQENNATVARELLQRLMARVTREEEHHPAAGQAAIRLAERSGVDGGLAGLFRVLMAQSRGHRRIAGGDRPADEPIDDALLAVNLLKRTWTGAPARADVLTATGLTVLQWDQVIEASLSP